MSRRSVSRAKPRIAFPLDHSVDDQSYESSGKFADPSTAKPKWREAHGTLDVPSPVILSMEISTEESRLPLERATALAL
jgi:hypothetical protein